MTENAKARRNPRRGLVEQEILEHAARLFAERGFAGTNFQDIADAVGLTRPALYHYVRSKDELLFKLVTEITEDAEADFAAVAARADLDAAAKLREIVVANVRRQATQSARFRLLIRSEADLPPGVAEAHAASRRTILRILATVIDAGIDAGSFRPVDARVAALGVLGMTNWVAWWYAPDARNDIDAICAQLGDLAVAGLVDTAGREAVDGPRAAIGDLRAGLDRLERMLDTQG